MSVTQFKNTVNTSSIIDYSSLSHGCTKVSTTIRGVDGCTYVVFEMEEVVIHIGMQYSGSKELIRLNHSVGDVV